VTKHVAVARSIWYCDPNFLTCCPDGTEGEHLLRYMKANYRVDMRRLSGHAFFECRQCQPATYFFAVFTRDPSPAVTCYAISKEDFDFWDRDPSATTLSTAEMLYRLKDPDSRSYNPYYRPPTERTK
jgi:hypothetical protein